MTQCVGISDVTHNTTGGTMDRAFDSRSTGDLLAWVQILDVAMFFLKFLLLYFVSILQGFCIHFVNCYTFDSRLWCSLVKGIWLGTHLFSYHVDLLYAWGMLLSCCDQLFNLVFSTWLSGLYCRREKEYVQLFGVRIPCWTFVFSICNNQHFIKIHEFEFEFVCLHLNSPFLIKCILSC